MTTQDNCRQTAIRAVIAAMGDDLERAQTAFQGLTDEEMEEEHGQSGRTRSQILSGYRVQRKRYEAALSWLKSLLPGKENA